MYAENSDVILRTVLRNGGLLTFKPLRTRYALDCFAHTIGSRRFTNDVTFDTVVRRLIFQLLFLLEFMLAVLLLSLHLRLHLSGLAVRCTLLLHLICHWLDDVVVVLPFRRFQPHLENWFEVDVLFVDVSE